MNTKQIMRNYSFYELLTEKISLFDDEITIAKIEIPKIQRDYVQGAATHGDAAKTQVLNPKGARFIDVLFQVLTKEEDSQLLMDFIYGSVLTDEKDGQTFSLLDGQQRLTTLYLLYWYIGKREGGWEEKKLSELLKKFTYETRESSRDFCTHLCTDSNFVPGVDGKPSELIKDCTWYFNTYNYDPTVKAMIFMLDQIHLRYESLACDGLFPKLERLRFYVLPLNKFQLSEELYVKMNARGKQLNEFENFKADLIQWMQCESNPFQERYAEKSGDRPRYLYISTQMDNVWSEYVWRQYREKHEEPDTLFFKFICRWLLNEYILLWTGSNDSLVKDEIFKILEKEKEYTDFAPFRIVLEKDADLINKLDKFLNNYCEIQMVDEKSQPLWKLEGTFSPFSKAITQRERAVLCGIQLYLERFDYEEIAFRQWIRVLWNITENTDINDFSSMIGLIKNTISELVQNGNVILTYLAANTSKIAAVRKEIQKAKFITADPHWEELFIEAEKHPFFRGSIEFLISDGMTIDMYKHRLKMVDKLFDAKGFSYTLAKDKHILIRAMISNIASFELLVGKNDYSGRNYPDKDEAEHYLKKYLSSEEDCTFIDTIRRYCDSSDIDEMLRAIQNDCSRDSIIDTSEKNKRVHEALYKYEALQEVMQSKSAIRICKREYEGYYASKPRSWYDWILLDSDRSEWIKDFFADHGFTTSDEILCGNTSFYWGKRVIFTGDVKYVSSKNMQAWVMINADGTLSIIDTHSEKEIEGVFAGINYHEKTAAEMRRILEEKLG